MHAEVFQLERKFWHDKNIRERTFQEGDWALFYISRFKDFNGNMLKIWIDPYLVEKYYENGSV